MKLTYKQFVDLCILCGSDFTKSTIKNIGPNKALKYIKLYENIENIIEYLIQIGKEVPNDNEFDYKFARNQFINPDIELITENFFK